MKTLNALIDRNTKLFFKDKGMFFTALITPMILLVLYATFLGNVYKDSFLMNLPPHLVPDESLVNGFVGGQLVSSILAVSCVTVAFCSNMLMVQDKANGTIRDLTISPVKGSTLAASYYISTLLSTLLICLVATVVCFGYLALTGFYLSLSDILFLLLDVLLLTMFGTALSSVISHFLSTQGQISAVGTIISSCYGFICGAYMPISQFPETLQKIISFLPGTYGTALVRTHAMDGVFRQMLSEGYPEELVESTRAAVDANIYFFGDKVSVPVMYMILGGSMLLFLMAYVLLNLRKKKAK